MTSSISINSVARFEILPRCLDKSPCDHLCQVVFSDKKKGCFVLDGYDIRVLIHAIAKEKISWHNGQDCDTIDSLYEHFSVYDNTDNTDAECILRTAFKDENLPLSDYA